MTSCLQNGLITWANASDLGNMPALGPCDSPLIPALNGTLMARDRGHHLAVRVTHLSPGIRWAGLRNEARTFDRPQPRAVMNHSAIVDLYECDGLPMAQPPTSPLHDRGYRCGAATG